MTNTMALSNKIDFWSIRLLELGKSNRLINSPKRAAGSRPIRTCIEFVAPNLQKLWDMFADGKSTLNIRTNYTHGELEKIENAESDAKYSDESGITTNQSIKDRLSTIANLKSKSKSLIEERGFNSLFLAFGFLVWEDHADNKLIMRSPLVLVPVQITQENLMAPLVISKLDDEIIGNKTLEQKLLNNFDIKITVFNEQFEIEDYFKTVLRECANLKATIDYSVDLSLFSFSKINMYQDLIVNRKLIINNEIVKMITGEKTSLKDISVGDAEFNYDKIDPENILSVLDADSSQQDAIALAKRGVSFVLQGPPGTGKSQTITNIISELLYLNKRVLFVSEKMAALDVVYKRLTAVGLKDFCLALHNRNADRREILDQLQASLDLCTKKCNLLNNVHNKLYELKQTREELNDYQKQLHDLPTKSRTIRILPEIQGLFL
jgi:hypothetical protein